MSEKALEVSSATLPPGYEAEASCADPMRAVGVLGKLSLEEWQWQRDCSEQGQNPATQIYVEKLAARVESFQSNPDKETGQLRANVATALLRRESLDPLFPGHSIAPATEEFLVGCLREEFLLAEQVQYYRTLSRWEPATLIYLLTEHFPRPTRMRFTHMVMGFKDEERAQFLRYWAGEDARWLSKEPYGRSTSLPTRYRQKQMALAEAVLQQTGVDLQGSEAVPRLYPAPRSSVFSKLLTNISVINKETPRLACRTTDSGFQQIVHSLSDVSSATASLILTAYNSHALFIQSGPVELRFTANRQVKKYCERFGDLFTSFQLRDIKRRRDMEDLETKALIDIAMRARGKSPLSREEEKELTIRLEAGSWAEVRYAQVHPEDCALGGLSLTALESHEEQGGQFINVSDEELLSLIELGRNSFLKLLQHNRGVIYKEMYNNVKKWSSDQNMTFWRYTGLRAFARTLYMFDYTKSYRTTTYFHQWARQYANQAAAAERGLTLRQWDDIGMMLKRTEDLRKLLGREPKDEEVQAKLKWTAKRFQQAKAIDEKKRSERSTLQLMEGSAEAEDEAVGPEDEVVEKVSASPLQKYEGLVDQRTFRIIRLRFEDDKELHEIAAILAITEEEVGERLSRAYVIIGQYVLYEATDAADT